KLAQGQSLGKGSQFIYWGDCPQPPTVRSCSFEYLFWAVPWLVAPPSSPQEAVLSWPPPLLCGSGLLVTGVHHHSPWLLAAQCHLETPAAVPAGQGPSLSSLTRASTPTCAVRWRPGRRVTTCSRSSWSLLDVALQGPQQTGAAGHPVSWDAGPLWGKTRVLFCSLGGEVGARAPWGWTATSGAGVSETLGSQVFRDLLLGSLSLVSGVQAFPGSFCCWPDGPALVERSAVFEVRPLLSIVGWTYGCCLRRGCSVSYGGDSGAPLVPAVSLPLSCSSLCDRHSRDVAVCSRHIPHIWAFSPAGTFLSTCQPSKCSDVEVLAAGL
uniref:Uncharacterized protein LOC105064974 n=1 Tax=Camelus bactrianus TaxID=9837 RepID=A0A9W3EIL3_CAMBA